MTAKSTSIDIYRPPAKVLLPSTVLLWMVIALFNTGIFVFSPETEEFISEFFYAFRWTLLYHSSWLVIIPSILFFARTFPLNEKITFTNLSVHLFLAFFLTFLSSIAHTYFISVRADTDFLIGNLTGNFLFYSADRLLIYFVILLGYYAIDYYRKQDEESFRELQFQEKINRENLNRFKNNIQPGFLLNTLHDIEDLIPSRPALAERLIADLAQMIRNMLRNSQKSVIRAEDDLQFLKTYIAVLEVRLNKKIHVHQSVQIERETRQLTDNRQDFAISLFVIHIVENLLQRDKQIFRTFSDLLYELFERNDSTEINVKLKRLSPSDPDTDFERWIKNEGSALLTQPFRENLKGQGPVELTYSADGILHFSINVLPGNS